jgi:uncharacterized protein
MGYVGDMKFSEADSGSGHLINGYSPGCIVVDGRDYREGLIVSPERIVSGWGPSRAADLGIEHVRELVELGPQVIVIGTGKRQCFPDPSVYLAAMDQGVGIEIMDTGAACRTYNIIMAEGRRVAAGLMVE